FASRPMLCAAAARGAAIRRPLRGQPAGREARASGSVQGPIDASVAPVDSGRMTSRAGELIRAAVTSWPGVEALPHRFGGTEYRYGKKEMGHVHGDRLADLPLPRRLHDEVIAAGRAQSHHVLPKSGWVSCWMDGPEDAAGVIGLFRVQYERYARPSSSQAFRRPGL